MVTVDYQLLDQRKERGDQQCPDRERERDDRGQRVDVHAAEYPAAAGRFYGPMVLAALVLAQASWLAGLGYVASRLTF